jgi:hypothetical protein
MEKRRRCGTNFKIMLFAKQVLVIINNSGQVLAINVNGGHGIDLKLF